MNKKKFKEGLQNFVIVVGFLIFMAFIIWARLILDKMYFQWLMG